MEGNKHYIRVVNGIVVRRFSDAFLKEAGGNEEILPEDICVNEDGERQYNEPWYNERMQNIYRWDGTNQVLRPQSELDEEWNARPPDPPTQVDILGQQLVERELENLELRAQNDVLGQQLVEIDLRLLQGGM